MCSQVTARQLAGFGITGDALVKRPGELLETAEWTLQFAAYPSEMHLWEGLLAFEKRRRILFSADLFIRSGIPRPATQALEWQEEIRGVRPAQVPAPEARAALQEALASLPVEYVAPGHGPFLKDRLLKHSRPTRTERHLPHPDGPAKVREVLPPHL